MTKTWIQSLSSKKIEPLALTRDMVGPIEEIAHSLAGEFRFTRQTQARYTVAEHCVRGSEMLPAAFAGAFLLHELSEVYLPDIAGPIKSGVFVHVPMADALAMGFNGGVDDAHVHVPWSALEKQHTRVILDALGLSSLEPLIYSPEVKAMDRAMLVAEKRDLLATPPEPWEEDKAGVEPAPTGLITPWDPAYAKERFLQRYRALFVFCEHKAILPAPSACDIPF